MTDYNNLPDGVEVTYTNFVECQYCGLRFSHNETAAMQNHWRDCPADHPARVEIGRLRAEVERLRAGCQKLIRQWEDDAGEVLAWCEVNEQDPGARAMMDCARDLRRTLKEGEADND